MRTYTKANVKQYHTSRNSRPLFWGLVVIAISTVGIWQLAHGYFKPHQTNAQFGEIQQTSEESSISSAPTEEPELTAKSLYVNVTIIDGELYGEDKQGNLFLLVDDAGYIGLVFPEHTMTNAAFGVFKDEVPLSEDGEVQPYDDLNKYIWYDLDLVSGDYSEVPSP